MKLRWPSAGLEPWLLGAWAVGCELAGRLLFPNWDVSYALYGARFWMDRSGPWMDVWPGLDLMWGSIARLLNQPEAAITLLGVLLNLVFTLLIWAVARKQEVDRGLAFCAALATGLWFKPPLGGWLGDHLSYGIALLPALLFLRNKGYWKWWLGITSGACLALGVTLKLNTSATGLLISALFITAALVKAQNLKKIDFRKIIMGCSWIFLGTLTTGYLLSMAMPSDGGLYSNIIKTYLLVAESQAASQANWQKILLVPLQINPIQALKEQQTGILIFSPLVLAFWSATAWNSWQILQKKDRNFRASTALLFLLSSALVGLSLGRGLTHKLFLLPAGLIFSISDLPFRLRWKRLLATGLLGYLIATWLSFAWVQRNNEKQGGYNSRLLFADSHPPQLCIGKTIPNQGVHRISFEKITTFTEIKKESTKSICWDRVEIAEQFAGLVDVQMLANELGISFRNQAEGGGDFREKWNWKQASSEGRSQWIREEAQRINRLQLPYLLERIPLNANELKDPQYSKWSAARLKQQQGLAKELGATAIARLGEVTLWRTRWSKNIK
jgi:hypothetical protein